MSNETPTAPETNAPTATELQPGAPAAAPADGVAAEPEQQQTQEDQATLEEQERRNKNRERFDRRFGELSKREREAREEAAYLRGQLEAIQRAGAQPQAQPPQAIDAAQADPEPDPESYPGKSYDAAYLRDVARWEGRQEVRRSNEAREQEAVRAREAQTAQREFEQGRERFFEARQDAEAIEEQFPQYAGVATQALDNIARAEPPGTPGRLVDIVTRAENRAWVATYLQTNPQELRAIAQMDPVNRAYAIGRLDARISANLSRSSQPPPAAQPTASAAATPPASSAPSVPQVAPPATLNGRAATPNLDPNKMSMEEYALWRNSMQ